MVSRPKYTKPDENQAEIVADLRAMGAVVWDLHNVGGKVLDLMVFLNGHSVPVEAKRIGCEKDLTDKEAEGMRELIWVGVFPLIVTRAEQVKEYIEELDA